MRNLVRVEGLGFRVLEPQPPKPRAQGQCAVGLLQKFQRTEYGDEWVRLIDAWAARGWGVYATY